MSRAFVKEADGDDVAEELPQRIHSDEPNYITASGASALEQQLRELLGQHAVIENDADHLGKKGELQRLDRDISYLKERIQRAQVIEPAPSPHDQVRFGHCVSLVDESGEEYRFTVVGEDETEPESGRISWTSVLGKLLLQKKVGDIINWQRPDAELELEVMDIFYPGE